MTTPRDTFAGHSVDAGSSGLARSARLRSGIVGRGCSTYSNASRVMVPGVRTSDGQRNRRVPTTSRLTPEDVTVSGVSHSPDCGTARRTLSGKRVSCSGRSDSSSLPVPGLTSRYTRRGPRVPVSQDGPPPMRCAQTGPPLCEQRSVHCDGSQRSLRGIAVLVGVNPDLFYHAKGSLGVTGICL